MKDGQTVIDLDEDRQKKALEKVKEYQERRKIEIEEEERMYAPQAVVSNQDS